jgi:hypothetical protein
MARASQQSLGREDIVMNKRLFATNSAYAALAASMMLGLIGQPDVAFAQDAAADEGDQEIVVTATGRSEAASKVPYTNLH